MTDRKVIFMYNMVNTDVICPNCGEVTDQQEEIYILRCNIEPLAENHMDDSEAMDSQDKHAIKLLREEEAKADRKE